MVVTLSSYVAQLADTDYANAVETSPNGKAITPLSAKNLFSFF